MFEKELDTLLNINKKGIWVKSELEREVMPSIVNTLKENGFDNIYTFSAAIGLNTIEIEKNDLVYTQINANPNLSILLEQFKSIQKDKNSMDCSAFILKDIDAQFNNPTWIRMFREMLEINHNKYTPIIILSSKYEQVLGLDHQFSVLSYDELTIEDIVHLLESYKKNRQVDFLVESISKLLIGFNRQEIIELLDLSFYEYNELNLDLIKEKKIDLIKRNDVLDYKIPHVSMSDIGGNEKFKSWFEESKICMSDEARKCGIDMPKGYLALGIPGTSKSFMAEVVAKELDIPFLKLNMSKILSKFVGESERKIEQAVNLIESCAPCVLLIDEVEKNLGGYASSNASDSGTLARVFGKILDMLVNNDKGIFTIMTSNNVKDLPPELTRAGRLDAIWYFSIPNLEERKEIFKLHANKKNIEINATAINEAAKATEGYTGAEIEQIVKSSMRKGFLRCHKDGEDFKVSKEDLLEAKSDVIPVSESSKEKIQELEEWVKGRALYANGGPTKKTKMTAPKSATIKEASKLVKK